MAVEYLNNHPDFSANGQDESVDIDFSPDNYEYEWPLTASAMEELRTYEEAARLQVCEETNPYNPELNNFYYVEFTSNSRGRAKRGKRAGEKVYRHDRGVAMVVHRRSDSVVTYPVIRGEMRACRRRDPDILQPDQLADAYLTHIPNPMDRTIDKLLELIRERTEQLKETVQLRISVRDRSKSWRDINF